MKGPRIKNQRSRYSWGVILKSEAFVGIDPGVTTAVAILDIDGRLIGLRSGKDFTFRRMLEHISSVCTPIVISTDVTSAPKLLEKVAAAFSAHLFLPSEDLQRIEKSRLVKAFGDHPKDGHERDALAAAIAAFDAHRPLLEKIERKIAMDAIGNRVTKGMIARKVITGESRNIEDAVRSGSMASGDDRKSTDRPQKNHDHRRMLSIKERELRGLREMLSEADKRQREMEREIKELESSIAGRKGEIEKSLALKASRETALLKNMLDAQKKENRKCMEDIENSTRMMSRIVQGWKPAIYAESCDRALMKSIDARHGIEGKFLLIGNGSKTSGMQLAEKAEFIFCSGELLKAMKAIGMKAIDDSATDHIISGEFAAVKIDDITIERKKKEQFVSWLDNYKDREFRPCRLR